MDLIKANTCYCGSNALFSECCELLLLNKRIAETPEKLMRSRYCAYVIMDVNYLLNTTHPSMRKYYSETAIRKWAEQLMWLQLTIHEAKGNKVKFTASFLNENDELNYHNEHSTFKLKDQRWYFYDGEDW